MDTTTIPIHYPNPDPEKADLPGTVVVAPAPEEESGGGREKWGSKWEYLLSLVSIAIGLGNVWRFPYICYKNGGGAFLIPYFLMLAFVGLPLFLLESSLGQFSSSGCLTLYQACPAFKGIGFTSVIVTLIASTYYSVVIAYPLIYLPYSFWAELPWASCDNSWNTRACTKYLDPKNYSLSNSEFSISPTSPAEEFFHNKILELSPGITESNGLVYPVVGATLFVWVFVFFSIFKGVKGVGKVAWFTSTFPFMMLMALLVRGLTLPGAMQGIKYFIYPDFSKLANIQVWADAASQIFFSLQVGWGSIIAMGSCNDFKNNSIKDALWIPILNCATSILAGFIVFSILGFMSLMKGVSIHEVVSAGPSLAFITYPEVLAMMPVPQLWSIFFFLMLFFLGVGSCFVQIETLVVSVTDEFPQLRKHKCLMAFGVCFFLFLGSISYCTQAGTYAMVLSDYYSVSVPITVACLAEVLVFSYIYGGGLLIEDFRLMTGINLNNFWWMCWMGFTPLVLLLIILNNLVCIAGVTLSYNDYIFPVEAEYVGWAIIALPVAAIPIVWCVTVASTKGHSMTQKLKSAHTPTANWGPKSPSDRAAWVELNPKTPSWRKRLLPPSVGI